MPSQPFTELGVALTRYREVACADLDVGIFTGPEIRRRLLRQRALSGKISLGIRIDSSGPEQSCLGLIQFSGQPALEGRWIFVGNILLVHFQREVRIEPQRLGALGPRLLLPS